MQNFDLVGRVLGMESDGDCSVVTIEANERQHAVVYNARLDRFAPYAEVVFQQKQTGPLWERQVWQKVTINGRSSEVSVPAYQAAEYLKRHERLITNPL